MGKSVTDSPASGAPLIPPSCSILTFRSYYGPEATQYWECSRRPVSLVCMAAKWRAFSSQVALGTAAGFWVWADTVMWVSELSLDMWFIPRLRAYLLLPPAPFTGLRGLSLSPSGQDRLPWWLAPWLLTWLLSSDGLLWGQPSPVHSTVASAC